MRDAFKNEMRMLKLRLSQLMWRMRRQTECPVARAGCWRCQNDVTCVDFDCGVVVHNKCCTLSRSYRENCETWRCECRGVGALPVGDRVVVHPTG